MEKPSWGSSVVHKRLLFHGCVGRASDTPERPHSWRAGRPQAPQCPHGLPCRKDRVGPRTHHGEALLRGFAAFPLIPTLRCCCKTVVLTLEWRGIEKWCDDWLRFDFVSREVWITYLKQKKKCQFLILEKNCQHNSDFMMGPHVSSHSDLCRMFETQQQGLLWHKADAPSDGLMWSSKPSY